MKWALLCTVFFTSFRQAARQASFVEVKMRALSWPCIIEFGTLSKFHGLLQTLSENDMSIFFTGF